MLFVVILAFTAGRLKNELMLILLGTVILVIQAYCFFGVFLLTLLHRRKARLLSVTINPEAASVGTETEIHIKTGGLSGKKPKFFRLPAINVRFELALETWDNRVMRHVINPGAEGPGRLRIKERGAYHAGLFPMSRKGERFIVADAPGFFYASFSVGEPGSLKLLALPLPAEKLIHFPPGHGGTSQRNEFNYRKSDELINHRPYIPGDDPRRINWKLYSHAPQGELFVREGESEPPPYSRLLILIDTEADISLFTLAESRLAVDALCENALAAARELSSKGMNIRISYSGGKISGEEDKGGFSPFDASGFARTLACPAAIPWPVAEENRRESGIELPPAPCDTAVLILALPRAASGSSGLDRFLKSRSGTQAVSILFIYDAGDNTVNQQPRHRGRGIKHLNTNKRATELEESAKTCVNLYNRRPGIHAAMASVSCRGTEAGDE